MPNYPMDLPARVEAIERLIPLILAAGQSRQALDVIRSGNLTVGDPDGAHIQLISMGDVGAEIWFVPGTGTNPTKLQADTAAGYTGEAAMHVVSGDAGAVSSELLLASGEVSMRVLDSGGDAGGSAYWGHDFAQFGFINGSTDNYFKFSSSSISRHYGQWDDFGSVTSDAGILCGSWTLASGFSGVHVPYPASMDSNMGPVAVIRDGNATPNFYWTLTASTTSGFDIDWSSGGGVLSGKAGYFWSFRH